MDESLVPIWVREYVEAKIAEALASKQGATPQAEVRSEIWRHRFWRVENHYSRPTVPEGKLEVTLRVTDAEYEALLNTPLPTSAAHFTESPGTPASPTPEGLSEYNPCNTPYLATESPGTPDPPTYPSSPEGLAYQAIDRLGRFRIGVHDYESCVACLRTNYKLVFGDDSPLTDPQDMIQRLVAEFQNERRKHA